MYIYILIDRYIYIRAHGGRACAYTHIHTHTHTLKKNPQAFSQSYAMCYSEGRPVPRDMTDIYIR